MCGNYHEVWMGHAYIILEGGNQFITADPNNPSSPCQCENKCNEMNDCEFWEFSMFPKDKPYYGRLRCSLMRNFRKAGTPCDISPFDCNIKGVSGKSNGNFSMI